MYSSFQQNKTLFIIKVSSPFDQKIYILVFIINLPNDSVWLFLGNNDQEREQVSGVLTLQS